MLGVCSTFLLARLFYDTTTAWVAALLLLLCPLYFAQSGMFLADVPVAALGVTCVYLALTRRFVAYLVVATYMVLLKETSVALIVALVLYLVLTAEEHTRERLVDALEYGIPLLAIGAFVVVQRITTGHFVAIYPFEFELFDPTAAAVRHQFDLITEWIFVNQFRWMLSLVIVVDLVWSGIRSRREIWLFGLVVALSGYSFSALYFLPRYLLPVLPFFYILAAGSVMRVARAQPVRIAAGTAAVGAMAWSLSVQPFWGNAEFNMRYLDVVHAHEDMVRYIEANAPNALVVTAWPHTHELEQPVLGYVDRPLRTTNYTTPSDVDGADFILVSSPPTENPELQAIADDGGWHVVRTVERRSITVTLYKRSGA